MEEKDRREERGVLLEVLEAELPRILPEFEVFDRGGGLHQGQLAPQRIEQVAALVEGGGQPPGGGAVPRCVLAKEA